MCFDVPFWWCLIADFIILALVLGGIMAIGLLVRGVRKMLLRGVQLLIRQLHRWGRHDHRHDQHH